MNIIAFTGVAGVGKDTACKAIIDQHPRSIHFSLAAPLYQCVAAAFNMTVNAVHHQKRSPISGDLMRHALESAGEWLDNLQPKSLILQRADEVYSHCAQTNFYRYFLINDVRTAAQAEWVREKGGVVVHLSRPANASASNSRHVTNQPLPVAPDDFELVNNTGIVSCFQMQVLGLLDKELVPFFEAQEAERGRPLKASQSFY